MREVSIEVDVMHTRLQAWAAWLTGGKSGAGYPTKSVLHASWLPPTSGMTPTMVISTGGDHRRERELDAAIRQALSVRLQNTLVVVYLMRASASEQAVRLDCEQATVRARVREAKRLLSMALHSSASV